MLFVQQTKMKFPSSWWYFDSYSIIAYLFLPLAIISWFDDPI